MSGKSEVEKIFRQFLDSPDSKKDDSEILSLVQDYLSNFDDEDDFTSYELDDFVNFYLEDNFENFANLQKKSVNLFERFLKFATEQKFIDQEEKKEWEEVLESSLS